jgi:hypothetical protein
MLGWMVKKLGLHTGLECVAYVSAAAVIILAAMLRMLSELRCGAALCLAAALIRGWPSI